MAYIQARAGSKRFPRKALANWNGKPLIADAIEKVMHVPMIDTIAISSDDPEILAIAADYGVMPIWRTAFTASDIATDDDVAAEVLRYFPKASEVCKMYPCIPLCTPQMIIDAWVEMHSCEYDSDGPWIHGVYPVDPDGKDAGAFYWFRKASYKQFGTIALNRFPWNKMEFPKTCIQDINLPEDLEIAKLKAI